MRAVLFASLCWFVAQNGIASDNPLQYPLAVVSDNQGTLFIADRDLPGIWQLKAGELTPYFQGLKKFQTPLNAVRCLALDNAGHLLAGDSATREIYRFSDSHKPEPLTGGKIGIPMALAVAADGSIVASDLETQRLVRIPAAGGAPSEIVSLNAVRGLAIDSQGDIWAANHGIDALIKFSPDGKQRTVVVAGRPFQFSHHLVVDSAGAAYLADGYAKTIWKIAPGMPPEPLTANGPLQNPVGLALGDDHLIVVDPRARGVFQLTFAGVLTPLFPR